jgi:hypothetical protein
MDLLQFVRVPGLEIAAQTLLNIWDALEMVEVVLHEHFVPVLTVI